MGKEIPAVFWGIAVLTFIHNAVALTCLECDQQNCQDVGSLRCKGGLTLDPCGCCTVCAKVEGESCGGPWNIAGVCDKGLVCSPQSDLQPGKCKNPMGQPTSQRLPKCLQRHRNMPRSKWCARRPTVFCNKFCERCCVSHTTCNPDYKKYRPKARCLRQQRLYAPNKIIFGDEADGDVNEIETEYDERKG